MRLGDVIPSAEGESLPSAEGESLTAVSNFWPTSAVPVADVPVAPNSTSCPYGGDGDEPQSSERPEVGRHTRRLRQCVIILAVLLVGISLAWGLPPPTLPPLPPPTPLSPSPPPPQPPRLQGQGVKAKGEGQDVKAKGEASAIDSDPNQKLSVFLHTNYDVRPPPEHMQIEITQGFWWNNAAHYNASVFEARALTKLRNGSPSTPFLGRRPRKLHIQFALTHRTEWMLEVDRGQPEPWVVLDTDVIMQCSAEEFRRRFDTFNSPLVVSATKRWAPVPMPRLERWGRNPWPKSSIGFRYPNSGTLAGTRAAFRLLRQLERKLPHYPCCPSVSNGTFYSPTTRPTYPDTLACLTEQQHCLQAVLQLGGVQYVVDTNASLFLTLASVRYDELAPGPDGRLVFKPTGVAPCVLHFDSDGTSGNLSQNAWRAPPWAWAPLRTLKAAHGSVVREFAIKVGGGSKGQAWPGTKTTKTTQPELRTVARAADHAALPHCAVEANAHRGSALLRQPPCKCRAADTSSCSAVSTRLCVGLAMIFNASCEQLGSVPFMVSVVTQIGLVPDSRGPQLYGKYLPAMLNGRVYGGRVGLWQNPEQLAAALVYVARAQEPTHSYVEVGVYSMWTHCLLAAYLQRAAAGGAAFRALAVDITLKWTTAETRLLAKQLNVSIMGRHDPGFGSAVLAPSRSLHDLCFIDALHTYAGVKDDYSHFAPRCRRIMFHDVQDGNLLAGDNYTGGVPVFWMHLRRYVEQGRTYEFLAQPGVEKVSSFGIGIFEPHRKTGTAEPDTAIAEWTPWDGRGFELLKQELCKLPGRPVCQRADAHRYPSSKRFTHRVAPPSGNKA